MHISFDRLYTVYSKKYKSSMKVIGKVLEFGKCTISIKNKNDEWVIYDACEHFRLHDCGSISFSDSEYNEHFYKGNYHCVKECVVMQTYGESYE